MLKLYTNDWHFCMILGSFIPNRVSQKYLPLMATHVHSRSRTTSTMLYYYAPQQYTQCAPEIRETYIGLLGNPSRRTSSRPPPPRCRIELSQSGKITIIRTFPHLHSKIVVCQYLLGVARHVFCFSLFHTTFRKLKCSFLILMP